MTLDLVNYDVKVREAVESFERIISTPKESIKINRSLVSLENERRGEQKLKQILSR